MATYQLTGYDTFDDYTQVSQDNTYTCTCKLIIAYLSIVVILYKGVFEGCNFCGFCEFLHHLRKLKLQVMHVVEPHGSIVQLFLQK